MDERRWEKLAAATGIGFVALLLVSSFIVPEMLKIDDPLSKIARHYRNHRTALLWSGYLGGLAAALFLWFAATVASYLRRHGAARLATTSVAGGVAAIGLALAGGLAGGELAFRSGGLDAGSTRVLFDINQMTFVVIWFPLAVFVGAVSIGGMRTRSLPGWMAGTGAPVAVFELIAATTVSRSGAWAPGGAFNFVAFLVFAAWTLALSVALWMRVGEPEDAKAMEHERPMAMTA